MKDRYSFAVAVIMSMVISVSGVLISLYEVGQNNHKFCQIIHTATAIPAPKPADPDANPSREKNYEGYVVFVNLGYSLGCGGPTKGQKQEVIDEGTKRTLRLYYAGSSVSADRRHGSSCFTEPD